MKWRLMALLWVGLVLTSTARAQIWPASGLWWQPGSNGKFMQLNIGPGGYALVTLSYSEGGQPTSRILQGQLESGVPALDGHFARLESPLYRIDDAGCLGCDDRDGRTVTDDPALHRLSFSSGTSANLLLPNGQQLRYELFPLITQLDETLAARFSTERLLVREGPNAAQARPIVIRIPQACAASLPSDVTLVRFAFNEDAANANKLTNELRSALLAIESGINPTISLLSVSSLAAAQPRCHIQGCPGTGFCNVIANLTETSNGLAGYFTGPMAKHGATDTLQVLVLD